jgi:SAM-dependent methyltransferase
MSEKRQRYLSTGDIYNNEEYLAINSNWHQEDSPYKASLVKKMIKRNNLTFDICADIGCGAGLITEILSKEYVGSNFIGCDLSRDANAFWEQRSKYSNLEFTNRDITEDSDVFDLIVCLDVFEHVENYFLFLKDLKKTGNKFIFNIPLDMNVMKVITNGIKFARTEVGHLHYFSEYTALQTLQDCGYQVKDSFLSAAYLSTLPRNKRQLAVLPFRLLTLALGKSFGARIFGGQSLVVYAEK